MKTVDADEAQTYLAQLLDDVARGDVVTITRHGVPVARLVPPGDDRPDPDAAVAALEAFQRSANITVGGASIRELIEEGRRY
jgi:prevent-host-death family protein